MTDIEDIYLMVKTAAAHAFDALQRGKIAWPTYRTYVDEYNHLLTLTKEKCGEEIDKYLKPIEVDSSRLSYDLIDYPGELLSIASLRLKQLEAYLDSKRPAVII